MLSGVLRSETAVKMSTQIISAFVVMRKFIINNAQLFQRIDDKDVYHFGASLKDLGKKWFAFSKLDKTAFSLLENLKKVNTDE